MSAPATTANVITNAAANAGQMELDNQKRQQTGRQQASALDVWRHTSAGLSRDVSPGQALMDGTPAGAVVGTYRGLTSDAHSSGLSDVGSALQSQASQIGQDAANIGKAKGALATVGATFGMLTSMEQALSAPLSMIPFPAFPALRVLDMDVGLPHAHAHPPNLIPPAPPVPLPSTGPVIPIPFLSGANKTLINGMPAARCGDMGLGIWCGGYFPMYEVFLGSSSVWIEGCRAARVGVDITKHCIFSSPKPSDPPMGPMVGFTITASANVLIGGVPMPSLLNMGMGALFKGLFAGMGCLARRLRGVGKAAQQAAEAADNLAAAAAHSASGFSRVRLAAFFRRLTRNLRSPRAAFWAWLEGRRLVAQMRRSRSIRIGGDARFQRAVMRDLRTMATRPSGRRTLERIQRSGRSVEIQPHGGGGANASRVDDVGARYDWQNNGPGRGADGNVGSDSVVRYDPGHNYGPETPSDSALNHEMGHAANNAEGTNMRDAGFSDPAETRRWTNLEEQNNISNNENPYRQESGFTTPRTNHGPVP